MKNKLTPKSNFVCQSCGFESSKWLGKCPSCGGWNSFVEEARRADLRPRNSRVKAASYGDSKPRMLDQISLADRARMRTGIAEFDRVTGGGVVPGSLLLVGGDPGIGKSTLTLQLMQALARDRTVLYVSGEESLEQIKLRADRLGVTSPNILLLSETALEAILPAIEDAKPDVVVIDSIQTMYRADLESAPGSVGQVRECGAELMRLAKQRTVATFLIGHVTKEGVIAGPRTLEHMVDTVLYLEGERHHAYRILRSVKNRFGSTNEIGVFEMREQGLAEVANPSRIFLSERSKSVPGSAVVCSLEGTRPLLVEIQALVTPTSFGMPQRNTTGFSHRRLAMLLAVLERRAGLNLGMHDVFVNVAGGLKLDEPAVDLGVACAIASAYKNRPADEDAVLIGEVGLGGEVRSVGQLEKRANEAQKLGFKRVIGPFAGFAPSGKPGIEVATVKFLSDAVGTVIH
ncbi:MAG: DNA repair protein RadA [Candidatus Edwardsbacteria bacterium]|nr:DNA repair protein RadA [Candidatus Edwardsbacteria bacterium]